VQLPVTVFGEWETPSNRENLRNTLLQLIPEKNKYISKFAYICFVNKQFEKYKGIHPGIIVE